MIHIASETDHTKSGGSSWLYVPLRKKPEKVPEFTLKGWALLFFYQLTLIVHGSPYVHPQRFLSDVPKLGFPFMLPNVIQIPKLFAIQYWVIVNGTYCWVLLVSWRERGRLGSGLEIGHPKFARSQFDWPTTKIIIYWSFEHAKK